ncbi:MAG TPA: DUF6580 family putative transport protein [Acidobacteriaceae bacterium]|jgi:hypothetical protein
MFAYFALLLAVLSRILPHAFHAASWNFTALGGGLLFFGSRMGTSGSGFDRRSAIKLGSAMALLMATDYYLTTFVYQFPFHASAYVVTWLWYAAVCLIGMGLLQKPTLLRVAAGAFATSTSFFLISNFMVWVGAASGGMYPKTLSGLAACYTLGLPFYRNDIASTAITAGVLFGLPVLAAKLAESMEAAHNQPLA